VPLGRLLDFALLTLDHCQRKISGDKSEWLLNEKRYSPYRLSTVVGLCNLTNGFRTSMQSLEICGLPPLCFASVLLA
jgi:hypothetical protein